MSKTRIDFIVARERSARINIIKALNALVYVKLGEQPLGHLECAETTLRMALVDIAEAQCASNAMLCDLLHVLEVQARSTMPKASTKQCAASATIEDEEPFQDVSVYVPPRRVCTCEECTPGNYDA